MFPQEGGGQGVGGDKRMTLQGLKQNPLRSLNLML